MQAQAMQSPVVPADIAEYASSPFGKDILGLQQSVIGRGMTRLSLGWFSEDTDVGLNLTKRKEEVDPLQDDLSMLHGNDPGTIAEDLKGIPADDHSWLLSSPSWEIYNQRKQFIRMGLPEAQQQASTLGYAAGMVADTAAFTLLGIAAEPLAIAGLGARTTLAGRAASTSLGRTATQAPAAAIAEAAATVGRVNLGLRYTALGVGEEAVFQLAKKTIDPLYDPTPGEIAWDMTVSGSLAGAIGGLAFGRQFVRDNIAASVADLQASRVTKLPGGYEVSYAPRWSFDSPAAADRMLFAPGTGSLDFEVERVTRELWSDWSRTGTFGTTTFDPVIDLSIPGTRTQGLPVIQPEAPLREFDQRTWEGVRFGEGRENVPTPKPGELPPTNPNTAEFQQWFAGSVVVNAKNKPLKVFRGVSPNFRGFGEADGPIYFSEDAAHAQRAGEVKGNVGGPVEAYLVIKNPYRTADPDGVSFMTKARMEELRKQGYDGAIGQMAYGDNIEYVVFSPDQVRYARKTPALKLPPMQSVRSAIKAAAFELSLAGMTLSDEVFAKVGKALVNADRTKTKAGGFNKVFWEELSKDLPGEVVANLRKPGERTFIGGIDRTVMDVALREDMVDSVWDAFKFKQHKQPGTPPSLIFQILDEIRDRGGKVNREMVANVIDELRQVSQNPPKRLNAKNVMVLDTYARRAQLIEIINKRVIDKNNIQIAPSLMKRTSPDVAARIEAPGMATASLTGGVAKDASDVPVNKVRIPLWDRIGNQSALLHQSTNGWARLVGNLSFFARRDMGTAQKHTIFEWGTQKMHSSFAMFQKGYRNGFVRYVLGNGTESVDRNLTLMDGLMSLGKSEMRRKFDARVAKQLRTGAYDDALPAVNDTAKGIREMFNKFHDIAHSVGLAGFQKSAVANYMPRMWRWDRIRRLSTTEAGKSSLTALIRQAIDMDGRRVVLDGIEQVYDGDIDQAATTFAERLIAIAKGTENAPITEQEQDLFNAIVELSGPLKAKQGSKTPFGRSRMMLNELAEIDGGEDLLATGKNTLSIADLTNDDLPFVFRKYVTSVMGAVNERQLLNAFNDEMRARGILSPSKMKNGEMVQQEVEVTSIDQMIQMVKKLGGTLDPNHESALREVIAAMRYEPIHHGRTRFTDQVLPILSGYGYLTTGGQFGLAAMSEISRVVSTLGVMSTVRQMPILMEMVENWWRLDADGKNFASAVDAMFSPSTDRLRRAFNEQFDVLRADYATDSFREASLKRAGKVIGAAGNLLSDISLLSPVNSFSQHLTAATTLQHLWEASRGGRKMDASLVRTLGLEPEQYENLIQWVGKNASIEKKFLGDRVVDLKNIDAKEMTHLAQFVDRLVRTRIQDMPTRGDFHKGMFSFLGKLLTQFRSFNLKGIDNFLLQNTSRFLSGETGAKRRVLSEISATMMFAGTIQYLRNYADWASFDAAGNRDKADQMASQLTVEGFVRGALAGPSEFFVPALVTDTAWNKLVDKDPLFSPYRYSGLSMYEMPAWALGSKALSVGTDVYGATVGEAFGLDLERDITTGTLRKARMLLPFQNLLGLKQYFNIKEQDIADFWNLPERQSR